MTSPRRSAERPEFDISYAYDEFPRIEKAFGEALDISLAPRGPQMMLDLARSYRLGAGRVVLDVGCGEGRHTLALAKALGVDVIGIDPVPRHLELACAALAEGESRELVARTSFAMGAAEQLPIRRDAVDLIWCRDVLVHVQALELAFREMARVMRPGARALVYGMFATDLLEPEEKGRLYGPLGVVPASAETDNFERVIRPAGLTMYDKIEIGTEWGEHAEETTRKPSRLLLHAARLTRDKQRYVEQFGQSAYDVKLSDALWHIYGMIGKLTRRIYCLQLS